MNNKAFSILCLSALLGECSMIPAYEKLAAPDSGSADAASAGRTDLFTGPPTTWSFSPQIMIPIFGVGSTWAALSVSKITKKIEIANYEKAIQSAFRDVGDALAVRSIIDERIKAPEFLLGAQQNAMS